MTTGRINQVASLAPPRRVTFDTTWGDRHPRAGREHLNIAHRRDGGSVRPARPSRRTARDSGHPIAPTEIPRAGPPQGPGNPPNGVHGTAAYGPRVRGTKPRSRRRTADTTAGLSSGV